MKCRYHKDCPLFNPEAVCCNDDDEANGYCGKWIEFNNKGVDLK